MSRTRSTQSTSSLPSESLDCGVNPRALALARAFRPALVTTDGWSVSSTTSSHTVGAVLSVFRGFVNGRPRYGDGNGRTFPTSDHARAWAFDRGYLQVHRLGFCPLCKVQHFFCGSRMGACARAAGHPYHGSDEAQVHFDASRRHGRHGRRA